MEPETFGRYRLLESIGRGGMAEVFLAKQEGIAGVERRLAIKRIHPQFTTDENFVKMFIDEARIVGHFSHQNIVQMLDFGKIRDTYYIAMEYVDGISIAGIMGNCLRAGVRIPPEAIIELGIQIGQGMDYAHNGTDESGQPLGIIHRDLTPHNILVSRAGTVKITDFGIAKASMNTHMTQAGMIKGKVPYMSPEQAMGQPLDRRSDLFAIGIILYEMCALQRLFQGPSDFHVLQKVIAADIPQIRAQNPEIPEELERIIRKLLKQNREERYANAGELTDDLRRLKFSMGETFGRFNLGAYVIHAIEEPQTSMDEASATVRFDERKHGAKAASPAKIGPSAFEGITSGEGGFANNLAAGDDDEVRTVLMASPTEEPASSPFDGDHATRLIQTGETAREDVARILGGAQGAGEASTMMAPPQNQGMTRGSTSAALAHEDDARTLMVGGGDDDPDRTMLGGSLGGPATPPVGGRPTSSKVSLAGAADPGADDAPTEALEKPPKVELQMTPKKGPPPKGLFLALGVVLFLLAFGYWYLFANRASGGSLTVQVSPDPAEIYLDGVKVSENGLLSRDNLPAGAEMRLRVQKAGYVSQEETVVLTDGQSLALPITLVPETPADGYFVLISEPPGARVLIGGKTTQYVTPARVPLKPGESHVVSLEKDGYQSQELTIEVEPNKQVERTITLAPAAPPAAGP